MLLLLCGSCWSARPIVMLKRFPTSRAVGLVLGHRQPRGRQRDAVLRHRQDRRVVPEQRVQLAVADDCPGAVEARRLDPVMELVVLAGRDEREAGLRQHGAEGGARLGRSVRQRHRLRRERRELSHRQGQRWELDQVVTRRILDRDARLRRRRRRARSERHGDRAERSGSQGRDDGCADVHGSSSGGGAGAKRLLQEVGHDWDRVVEIDGAENVWSTALRCCTPARSRSPRTRAATQPNAQEMHTRRLIDRA